MRRLLLVLTLIAALVPSSVIVAAPQPVRIHVIAPASAHHGDYVLMLGSGFAGRSVKVSVGGVPAPVILGTNLFVIFRVPDAAPSGKVVVSATNRNGQTGRIGFEVIGGAFDGSATPLVNSAQSTSLTIGPDGGTISAGGMTLSIPAGALVEETSITVTPMTGLQGTPFDQFVVGAVFEPAGLRFINPATLTLPLPPDVTVQEAVSFAMNVENNQGTNFHLIPYQANGSTLSVTIPHFSAAGVVAADPTQLAEALGYEPSPADEANNQRIAAIGEQWEAGQLTDAQRDAAIDRALRDWYGSVRNGWTSATGASMEFFELAAADWIAWRARIRDYGRDDSFVAELAESRGLALAAATDMVGRLLSRCTGTGDPYEPLNDILRFAVYIELDSETFNFSPEHPEWESANGLSKECLSIVIEKFEPPAVLASSRTNTFEISAYVDFYNGPDRRDIPLIFELYRLEPLANVLEATVTTSTGRASLPVQVSDEKPTQSYTLDVTLEEARTADSNVLRSFTVFESLTRPVRDRIELTSKRANDTDYRDDISSVRVGTSVSLRVRVAGDRMEDVVVNLALEGSGTITDTSTEIGSGGEAFINYTAPENPEGNVCIVASIPESGGGTSDSRLCFNVISDAVVYTGSILSTISQPGFTTCVVNRCQTRTGSLRDNYTVRLELQPNGTFAASGSFTHELFDQSTTEYDTGETCQSSRHETGGGTVVSYSGTLTNPVGSLTATYSYTQTITFSPCNGQPGSTSTDTGVRTASFGSNQGTPVYDGDVLIAIIWDISSFDQATETTYATTGRFDLVQ